MRACTALLPHLLATACTAHAPAPAPVCAMAEEILWLPDGTQILSDAARPIALRQGRSVYPDGSAAVTFRVVADHEALSDVLIQRFHERGWQQRATQYLNPQMPTSFSEGWQHRCGCVVVSGHNEPTYAWRGEWQDQGGDITTYSLTFIGAEGYGYAACVPKSRVNAARR